MGTTSKDTISIISTATVRAPVDDHRTVELTPWDLKLLLLGPIQKGLLFHKPKHTTSLVNDLKASLSLTLNHFPPLAGRLSRTDDPATATASFSIDCNNAGAQFVHAAADFVSVSDILAPYVPPVVHSLFPLDGAANEHGVARPLLAVQVTELADGIFLGCTVNHVAADGTAFWLFLNSWSEISRSGHGWLAKPPCLRRWFLGGGGACTLRVPLAQLDPSERVGIDWHPDLAERIFHFGKESVAELKARANREMGTDGRISSLQAVLAHLWRSVVRNRHVGSDEEEVTFVVVLGARPRIQHFPEHYFGNATQAARITRKASEVVERGIGHAAWEINQIVGLHTQEKMETYLDSWAKSPRLVTMGDLAWKDSLYCSSSPRFDVYGNDFGWGRPIAVRSGVANKYDGKISLFSGAEPGSIEVQACFLPQTLCAMEKDVEFMDKVTR